VRNLLIEICCYSVESAIIAQSAGASRIELCDNIFEGGTTPSAGAIISARKKLDIPLNIIIRPRGGDFLYSDIEFDQMKIDIRIAKENNADGIVLGLLNADGSIDVNRTKELIGIARPMTVTFHRAFDMCKSPFIALEELIDLDVERILTSGQNKSAIEGKKLISELVKEADNRIIIMPGSGINLNNFEELIRSTNAFEYHLSGKKSVPGNMEYHNPEINIGGFKEVSEYNVWVSDEELIKNMVLIAKNNKLKFN